MSNSALRIAYLLDQTKSTTDFLDSDFISAVTEAKQFAECADLLGGLSMDEFGVKLRVFVQDKSFWTDTERDIHGSVSPLVWWMNDQRFKNLRLPAVRGFSTATSSAASERAWSSFDFLHSASRNRLGSSTIDSLAYIFTNMERERKRTNDIFYMTYDFAQWGEDSVGVDIEHNDSHEGDHECSEGTLNGENGGDVANPGDSSQRSNSLDFGNDHHDAFTDRSKCSPNQPLNS